MATEYLYSVYIGPNFLIFGIHYTAKHYLAHQRVHSLHSIAVKESDIVLTSHSHNSHSLRVLQCLDDYG